MGLETDQSVGDVYSCIFQSSRPFNVSRLVEAGLELDQDCDLFAPFCGLDQGAPDRGIGACTVEGLFDCQDLRIACRSFDKGLCAGCETVIRMVDEDIAFADDGKDIGRAGLAADTGEGRMSLRGPWLVLEVGQVDVCERQKICDAERAFVAVDISVVELHLLHQDGANVFGH